MDEVYPFAMWYSVLGQNVLAQQEIYVFGQVQSSVGESPNASFFL